MAAILPGFKYDIFISYRHNDNLDGWVTDFVNNLEKELKGTLKDSITIYFDRNPHDGLLETHIVDKSLEGKLKCLIFVPVISQTYCDPKSFAWQHEFCAFNKLATEDQFGRDIKLGDGNVASRILPVKIHNLDAEDKALLEKELGGVLRPIEFIFKSPGVNRPLTSNDKRDENSNKIFYRDQVNKAANAIKEIIIKLRNFEVSEANQEIKLQPLARVQEIPKRNIKRNLIVIAGVLIVFLLALYFFNPVNKSKNDVAETNRSVAVLAFSDLSQKKDQEWFSDGLTDEILNSLANLPGLKVTARTSSFYFKDKNVTLQEIAQKLGVAHVVEGSVQRLGNQLRVTVQLIRAKDGFHIWSQTYNRTSDDLFNVETDIAENVAKALLNKFDQETKVQLAIDKPTSFEAYSQYLQGLRIYYLAHIDWDIEEKLPVANEYFENAISLDPSFGYPYYFISDLYIHQLEVESLGKPYDRNNTYVRLHEYLGKAIQFSNDSTRTKFLQFIKCLMSDNWSDLSVLSNTFINDPRASKIASETGLGATVVAFSLLKRENDLFRICNQALKIDPYNSILWQFGAGVLAKKNPEMALEFLTKGEAAMKTRLQGLHEGLERVIREKASLGQAPLTVNKDSLAKDNLQRKFAVIDNLPHGHLILMSYYYDGYSIDMKSTPNFAARLKELTHSN